MFKLAFMALVASLLIGCEPVDTTTSDEDTTDSPASSSSGSSSGGGSSTSGGVNAAGLTIMRLDGSMYISRSAALALLEDDSDIIGVELSGPLMPKVLYLYANEGQQYPSNEAGQLEVAENGFLTFPELREECNNLAQYAVKVISAEEAAELGEGLTDEMQLASYGAIAQCAYEQKTSKPYTIPQLHEDVDVCAAVLGDEWRTPTEEDVTSILTGADFLKFQEIMESAITAGTSTNGSWAHFYFSLATIIRGEDGMAKVASLRSDADPRVAEITVDKKLHLEGFTMGGQSTTVTPRCIRYDYASE